LEVPSTGSGSAFDSGIKSTNQRINIPMGEALELRGEALEPREERFDRYGLRSQGFTFPAMILILRLKLTILRCSGEGDHIADIPHAGNELHDPLEA
jgi:hypothetical protein